MKINLFSSTKIFVFVVVDEKNTDSSPVSEGLGFETRCLGLGLGFKEKVSPFTDQNQDQDLTQ